MASSSRVGIRALLDRLIAALADPTRRERAIVPVLIAYCGLWALYGAVAKGSQDIHFDMGEMVAWSRETFWGTPKHPPFGAWLVSAWFSVFPLADWAYYLFTLVPFFNFHALKYNANTVMIPLWAATTALFLRSYETRNPVWAVLAGLAAAAAMLGKYWSIVLLLGLGLAALADQRRAAYFRSSAPWATVAAGLLGLSPHIAWLYANDFTPFTYAMETHPGTLVESLRSGLAYVAGAAAYVSLPVGFAVLAVW